MVIRSPGRQSVVWKVLSAQGWSPVSCFWSCIFLVSSLTLGSLSSPQGSQLCSLTTNPYSGSAEVNLTSSLFNFFSFPFPYGITFSWRERDPQITVLYLTEKSLPTANFSTPASLLRKLAVSTFQLIADWHTPDSKYLCSSRESLVQLST